MSTFLACAVVLLLALNIDANAGIYSEQLQRLESQEQQLALTMAGIEQQLRGEKGLDMRTVYSLHQQIDEMRRQLKTFEQSSLWADERAQLLLDGRQWQMAMRFHRQLMQDDLHLRRFWRDHAREKIESIRWFQMWKWRQLNLSTIRDLQYRYERYALNVNKSQDALLGDELDRLLFQERPLRLISIGTDLEQERRQWLAPKQAVDDFFHDVWQEGGQIVSKRYGNIVGKVKWRQGYLKGNHDAREILQRNLRPLDIILNKTGNKLTDLNIPGHFGHVAIYLGNEASLKAMGLWEKEWMLPFQARIRAGYSVVEMTRKGMNLTDAKDILESDEVAVLRWQQGAVTREDQQLAVERGLRQFGKQYDFNFNRNLTSRLTCAELVLQMFPDQEIAGKKIVGRLTVSPDDILELVKDDNMVPVLYLVGNKHGWAQTEARSIPLP